MGLLERLSACCGGQENNYSSALVQTYETPPRQKQRRKKSQELKIVCEHRPISPTQRLTLFGKDEVKETLDNISAICSENFNNKQLNKYLIISDFAKTLKNNAFLLSYNIFENIQNLSELVNNEQLNEKEIYDTMNKIIKNIPSDNKILKTTLEAHADEFKPWWCPPFFAK